MDEKTFLLFHYIVTAMEILLYAVYMAVFLHPFMISDTQEEKHSCKGFFSVFLAYSSIFLLCSLLPGRGWLYRIILTILLLASARFLHLERKLLFLLCMLFFCIQNLSMMSLSSVDYLFYRYLFVNVDTPEKIYLGAALNYIFIETLKLLFSGLMLYVLRRLLTRCGLVLHMRELGYLLLTPVTGILFVNIVLQLLIVTGESYIFQLYSQVPAAIAVIPVLSVLFYAGILATIAACQKIIGLQEERRKYSVEQQQLAAIQERMIQVEQFWDGTRRMKHEMRNHLTNIRGLAQSGCYEDMESYIARMGEGLDMFESGIRTGNAVADVIVNDKQKSADRMGIRFQVDFIYPVQGGYDAYDIGIILSNLLQNALEACEKMEDSRQRYILLSGRQKKNFFLLEVRNSFQGNIRFDKHTGLPLSTKDISPKSLLGLSASLHGIGLSNVRQEAKKYQGDVDIRVDENEFCATVLLQKRAGNNQETDS